MHVLPIIDATMLKRSSIDLWARNLLSKYLFKLGIFLELKYWVLATYQLLGRLGVVFIDLMQRFICFIEITVTNGQDKFSNLEYTKPPTNEIKFSIVV